MDASASATSDGGPASPTPDDRSGHVLVCAPESPERDAGAAADLLEGASPERTNLLVVTLSSTPGERLDRLRRLAPDGRLPANVGVVSVESAASEASGHDGEVRTGRTGGSRVAHATVPSAGDLTGLGMRISSCLSAWADDDARTVVQFDSLTTLLAHTDVERTFRFLHLLIRTVDDDALVHYHLDPRTCDDRTVAIIRSLLDRVRRPAAGE